MKKKKQKDDRRRKFILHYLRSYNATEAAKLAGYSPKTAYSIGSRLLKKVEIQNALEAAEHQLENKVGITKERILKELALIGFSSIDEHIEVDEGGAVRAKCFEDMPPGAVRAIKKVKEKRVIRTEKGTKDKPDGEEILDSTFEFELYDKPAALINMGKELGMFRERQEHTGKDGGPITVVIRKFGDGNNPTK